MRKLIRISTIMLILFALLVMPLGLLTPQAEASNSNIVLTSLSDGPGLAGAVLTTPDLTLTAVNPDTTKISGSTLQPEVTFTVDVGAPAKFISIMEGSPFQYMNALASTTIDNTILPFKTTEVAIMSISVPSAMQSYIIYIGRPLSLVIGLTYLTLIIGLIYLNLRSWRLNLKFPE